MVIRVLELNNRLSLTSRNTDIMKDHANNMQNLHSQQVGMYPDIHMTSQVVKGQQMISPPQLLSIHFKRRQGSLIVIKSYHKLVNALIWFNRYHHLEKITV